MEKEALLSSLTEALGRTELSEQTLEAYSSAVATLAGAEAELSDDFVANHVSILRSLNGQLHRDVSKEVSAWKERNASKDVEESNAVVNAKETGSEKSSVVEAKELEASILKLREELEAMKVSRAAAEAQAAKDALLRKVKRSFGERQKQAGLEVREYFLDNALSELSIEGSSEQDVEKLSETLEKKYNQHLKRAGIGTDAPRDGRMTYGDRGKTAIDKYFAAKKEKMGR